jgi:ATP-dependent DNA helicase RecG
MAIFISPGGYVQFLKFPGTNMMEIPNDQLGLSGDLRTVLDKLRVFNKQN